jgi:hypothetical protein
LKEQLGFPEVSAVARKKKSLLAMKASSIGLSVSWTLLLSMTSASRLVSKASWSSRCLSW